MLRVFVLPCAALLRLGLSFLSLVLLPETGLSQVRINEFMASNGSIIADEDGDFEDWIELYNESAEGVDLGGWGLSDNGSDPFRWTFAPGTLIEPGGYLLVWASGKDREPSGEAAGILREVWMGIPGTSVNDLTSHPDFPNRPTSGSVVTDRFEAPSNVADQYGQRMQAFLVPPQTGWYRFRLASDDNGALFLSSDRNPANAVQIAAVPGWTAPREWGKFPSQRSAAIYLDAGQAYHLAALMKEGGGGDNLAVAWERPDGVFEGPIPGQHFRIPLTEYHTNFRISSSGEELLLTNPNGQTVDYVAPVFLPRDISYGRRLDAGGEWQWVYFDQPTPGSANTGQPVVLPPEVTISEGRGFKTEPFYVTLSTPDPTATIRYTVNGSTPGPSSPVYVSPLHITGTTTLRASAVGPGMIRLPPTTTTWLFLNDILQQGAATPVGWPADRQVNNHRMEYGLRPAIVSGDNARLRQGMTSIPSISLVTDRDHLFAANTGIYSHSNQSHGWERPVSVELIDPDGNAEPGFQIDAGLRLRGAFSRSVDNPKHSLRLLFRSGYGERQLNFPLFGGEGVDAFDKIDLRTAQNYSWAFENNDHNTFLRDVFSRDSQRDMGVPYTRSRFYHLYLNGQYWGLYQTQERAESDYAAAYLGGESADWDVIKTSQPGYVTSLQSGTIDAWHALHQIALNEGFSGGFADNYWRVRGLNPDGSSNPDFPVYLDEENLSVYMLTAHYTGDPDSPISIWGGFPNNMYGLFNRVSPDGFKWLRHDAEHSLGSHGSYGVSSDTTGAGAGFTTQASFNPATLHLRLLEHPDYRMQFADLVQRHLFDGGALTPEKAQERVRARMAEIDLAIIAESARWGRGRTRDAHWVPAANQVLAYLDQRRDIVVGQFQNRGWFPTIPAPVWRLEGRSLRIGADTSFYYTTDGTDPRLPGGAVNPTAIFVEGGGGVGLSTLVERGASWRFFDQGMAPGDQGGLDWRAPGYDDGSWQEGPAVLGFGGASTQNPVATQTKRFVSGNSGPQVTTTYFRHSFLRDASGPVDELIFEILRDDGAVVYLNGTEVFRTNMPDGEPTYDTFASTVVGSPEQNTYFIHTLELGHLLVPEENHLAVAVHQVNATSSDLYFDLSLRGRAPAGGADIQVSRSDLVVARAWKDSEWSPQVQILAGEHFQPGLPIHGWDFEAEIDFLAPSYTLGGGGMEVVPGPLTQVLSNTGGDFETRHLRVNNPLGATVTWTLPTTGYGEIGLDFLTRRSGQGAGQQTLSYTIDGENWVEMRTYAIFDAPPQAQSFDFGAIAGVSDNPNFAVQITFAQAEGGLGGNNRFDEVALSGIPEAGTSLPPTLNAEAVPEELGLTAGAAPVVFDLTQWFSDPDGDELTFSSHSSNPAAVGVVVEGSTLILTPVGAGGATIRVDADDGSNLPVGAEFYLLVYPAPFVLNGANYLFHSWAADTPAAMFPEHMLFLQSEVNDPTLTTRLGRAYEIPLADAARGEDVEFPYGAESRSRINGLGEDGIAFVNTGRGRDVGSALLSLDTSGVSEIDVSWTAQTLLPNVRVYGLRLQYRIGSEGSWTDVLAEGEPVEFLRSEVAGHLAVLGPIRLPQEAEGQALVQCQWRYHHVEGISGARAQLRLDNIGVTSTGSPGGFAAWATENFGPVVDPLVSGAKAAPMGDGVPNLLKYALGLSAEDRIRAEQLETGQTVDRRFYLRFFRDPARTDVTYLVEASIDLADWSERLFDSGTYQGPNSDGEMHEVSVPIDGQVRRFLRLRVTQP
jgi:hypothetical protein